MEDKLVEITPTRQLTRLQFNAIADEATNPQLRVPVGKTQSH